MRREARICEEQRHQHGWMRPARCDGSASGVMRPAGQQRADDECHEDRMRRDGILTTLEAPIDADEHDAEQDPRDHVVD